MKTRTSWLLAALVMIAAVGCSRQDYQWGWYEVLPTTPQGAAHLKFLLAGVGLNYYQKMRLVILPQAIRRILPPLGNQFVYMLKMSSLVSVIGLQELTRRANELTVTVYRPLEIYSMLVVEYLLLILVASWMVRRLENRLRVRT